MTVLGAVAELERSLIAERVRAGLRNARAKGKRLGRPRVSVDTVQVARLRASGQSWRAIAEVLGVSVGTVHAASQGRSFQLCLLPPRRRILQIEELHRNGRTDICCSTHRGGFQSLKHHLCS